MINKYQKKLNKICKFCGKEIDTICISQRYHKECYKIYHYKDNKDRCKKWYWENRERTLKNKATWRDNNKERIRNYGVEYLNNNRDKIKEYNKKHNKERRRKDLNFAVKGRLINMLRRALNLYSTEGKIYSSKKYGIKFEDIIEHLKPFPEDLSKYHIDHIKPLSSFDLNNPDEVKKAFSPDNHQWLTIKENIIKGGINRKDYQD
jgi:hypothetical protein